MLRLKHMTFYAVNLALMVGSLICTGFPRVDEYLVLFMIPLLYLVAPYILSLRVMIFLMAGNLVFFLYYMGIGVLDHIDMISLSVLLIVSGGMSFMTMRLKDEFFGYNRSIVKNEGTRYNGIVRELEEVERKGRIVERELTRISRLYEITKQLGSVLKFDELLDAVFNFLEDNFKFEAAHLLVFNNGEFSQGVSKRKNGLSGSRRAEGGGINYPELVKYMGAKGYNPFFIEKGSDEGVFKKIGVAAETFLAFPLYVKDLSAIMAIEGANKLGYDRFSLVVPQIALELGKVELYEQVEELSIIDGLTGVYLRRYLMERLEEEVDRAKRLGLTFAVGMIDIDNFKKCNDTYGHLVGDAVLKEVADRLSVSVREVDMIARYGGEEFCVVLPETTKDLALSVAERLRKAVECDNIKAFDESISTTISVGIATFPEDAKDVDSLIEMADRSLYRAKRQGRNRVVTT